MIAIMYLNDPSIELWSLDWLLSLHIFQVEHVLTTVPVALLAS